LRFRYSGRMKNDTEKTKWNKQPRTSAGLIALSFLT